MSLHIVDMIEDTGLYRKTLGTFKGSPTTNTTILPYKVDNYDNFLYNRKYERGIYKGCNGKIWRWTPTSARKEVIK